mmetsp:Transcript_33754/g.46258  ORF Transcript_33754/g.46258 Transcript_33754/m.46258 type:complete len:88 (+) Transcript_33754:310-573(+)
MEKEVRCGGHTLHMYQKFCFTSIQQFYGKLVYLMSMEMFLVYILSLLAIIAQYGMLLTILLTLNTLNILFRPLKMNGRLKSFNTKTV